MIQLYFKDNSAKTLEVMKTLIFSNKIQNLIMI